MNYIQKYNANKALMKGYEAFLPEVEFEDGHQKIMSEIKRLTRQNMEIEQMSFEEAMKETDDFVMDVRSHWNEAVAVGGKQEAVAVSSKQ